jgi:3-methyladenine DNA glycosylase Mpg
MQSFASFSAGRGGLNSANETVEITPQTAIRKAADLPLRFLVTRTSSKLRTP